MIKNRTLTPTRNSLRRMILLSFLIALQLVFSKTLAIRLPHIDITFGFFALALSGLILGPFYAACGAACADVIGFILFPRGVFFIGYTLTALLGGLVYGIFLYCKPKKLWRVIVATCIIKLGLHLGLNTFWAYLVGGRAFWAHLVTRTPAEFMQIPIQVAFIWFLAYRISESPPALPFKKEIQKN